MLAVAVLGLGVCSCQPLNKARPLSVGGRGELPPQTVPYTDAIPAAFGDVIGVTANPDYPAWSQVWFMKPDKSLVVLWVNAGSGRIYERMIEIPRR
jgi:hypothetical protein